MLYLGILGNGMKLVLEGQYGLEDYGVNFEAE